MSACVGGCAEASHQLVHMVAAPRSTPSVGDVLVTDMVARSAITPEDTICNPSLRPLMMEGLKCIRHGNTRLYIHYGVYQIPVVTGDHFISTDNYYDVKLATSWAYDNFTKLFLNE